MKVLTPRSSFSLDYTPRQWVSLCNTSILIFVTFMFGLVVYNMNGLDQRLIRVLDSSAVAIDLLATDILQSQTTSYWRTISNDLAIYSAFRQDDPDTKGNSILVIGSSSTDVVDVDDLRCLVKYDGEEDDIGIAFVDYRKPSNCSKTVFLYCRAKSMAVPKKVALVSDSSGLPKQWLEVRTIQSRVKRPSDPPTIAACVRPFSGAENPREVAEFVAFYEIIGLSHFYFYNRNAALEVENLALQLKGSGHSVNLLPWNKQEDPSVDNECPVDLSEHVQDCSHRAAGKYDYVLTVDILDYVVPMEYFGLPALIEEEYGNLSKLDMNCANFCKVPHSHSRFDNRIGLKIMTMKGPTTLSNSNYILRPEPALPDYRVLNSTELVRTLTEKEVLVHRHMKKCREALGVIDLSAYKYMNLVDESSVLQSFKRRS